MSNIELSVVIPVYQNANTLRELTERLIKVLSQIVNSFELVFVNDASPDESGDILQQLETKYHQVVVVTLISNQGQQNAIRIGVNISNGDKIVVMDADLQDSPEAIILLNNTLNDKKVEAVFAAHQGKYQSDWRMLTSRLFKWLICRITGLPKGAGCFVLFTRKMADNILSHNTKKFYLSGLIAMSPYPISAINIKRHIRTQGKSCYTPTMRLNVAKSYMQCILEVKIKCLKHP